jgi:type I restriction enzyme S subunit
LAEQKRIAAILDQADALRRLRTRALDRLNTLGQAIFQEMFGDGLADRSAWATAILDKIVLENDRINYGVVQPGDHDPLGVPIIRVADLASQAFNLGAVKRISREVDHSYRRSRLKGGEILIGCVGSIGTTLIAPPELKDANIARAVARVPVDPAICDPSFLNAYLRTQEVQNYFLKEVRLVAQPTLNIKQIKETPVFLPPREMQDEFSVRLKGVGALLMQAEHSGVGADFLFASLQHRAFRGEL